MNYTTIEQSKKLLELGLNPETADMTILHEEPYETSDSKFNGIHEILCVPFRKYDKPFRQKYRNISYFPAWSLEALIELMPKTISILVDDKSAYFYNLEWQFANDNSLRYIATNRESLIDIYSDHDIGSKSFIETAFEMVVWLIENSYIKTEKR